MDTQPTPQMPMAPATDEQAQTGDQEAVTQPAKLLRIATMVRELLEDTRQASLDEPGRIRLRQIYERAIGELQDVLSADLQEELSSLAPPMQGVPTDAEIRVAQAQLVGWLEGLFHGIQAALFAQQMAARQQFEELRRRGLPGGAPMPSDPADPSGQAPDAGRGQYL
ncbi:MAG TPA: proteasome activator [Actinomycetota bacterium]|nr:proteasome activator [Actinomycetota bacterium]